MDINQLQGELSRAVHQRLLNNQEFDAFVLARLWRLLSSRTKEALAVSRVWYFGKIQIAEHWQVPALVILFSGDALLAQPHYGSNLVEVANTCKVLTCCDRVHVLGSDTGIQLWFDHNGKQWQRQTMRLPADWHPEEG